MIFAAKDRKIVGRVIFGVIMIIWAYRFFAHAWISQLLDPVIMQPGIDNTFWLMHILGIPQFITQAPFALGLDLLVLISIMACFFNPYRIVFAWVLLCSYFLYMVCFSSYALPHFQLKGIFFIVLPFLFKDENTFNQLFSSIRYFLLLTYLIAFSQKLLQGGLFNIDQMSGIMAAQSIDYIVQHPGSSVSMMIQWLVGNPSAAHWIFILGSIAELAFIVGFFTRRYDSYLLILAVLLHGGIFILFRIPFAEYLAFHLVLLPWRNIIKLEMLNVKW